MTHNVGDEVYVLELEQPWTNWYGTIKEITRAGFYLVEDLDGAVHEVRYQQLTSI